MRPNFDSVAGSRRGYSPIASCPIIVSMRRGFSSLSGSSFPVAHAAIPRGISASRSSARNPRSANARIACPRPRSSTVVSYMYQRTCRNTPTTRKAPHGIPVAPVRRLSIVDATPSSPAVMDRLAIDFLPRRRSQALE